MCCSGPGAAGSILVQGRRCEVSLALSQDAARTLAAGAPQQGEGRRLYLVSALSAVLKAAIDVGSLACSSSTSNMLAAGPAACMQPGMQLCWPRLFSV